MRKLYCDNWKRLLWNWVQVLPCEAIDQINPAIPAEAKEEAIKRILRTESPDLVINNHRFHKMLVDGVDVEYRRPSGVDSRFRGNDRDVTYDKVWLFDFDNVNKNEFLAVNQFTVIENVLVGSRLVSDPETHQSFTIKRYHSEKGNLGNGQWRHKKITLSPDNKNFKDIVLENVNGEDFRVVAAFVEVIR